MPHTNENPSQQNKEILESFAKEFGHNLFCKDFPENEPKNCRCDYSEFQDFLLSALQEQKDGIMQKLFEKTTDGQLLIKFEDVIKVIETY